MFATSTSSDTNTYDFFSDENAPKWKGIFMTALNLVHKQVNPSLTAKEDALDYIEKLIIQLLATLCASEPHVPQDVEDRVQKTFPDPIDKWAIRDAERAIEKVDNRNKKNLTLVLPVEKIHPLLVKEVLGYRIDYTVTVYIVAVLEYIAADILKLTGNYVKNIKHPDLTSQDIKVAICADQVLMDMFSQEETEVSLPIVDEPVRRESLTYEETVKDFILEENQYLHDLNMIIKVFRAPFEQHFPGSKDLENIFSNILDIHQFTAKLLSSVEEQVEVAAENETPTVGICFQDLAEGEEFGVYMRYVDDMMAPQGKDRLHTLMQRPDFNQTLQGYGSGFKDAMKYSLPKLLLGPIYHCLHYFEVLKALIVTSPNEEDSECLEQASGLLAPIKYLMENKFSGNLAKKKPWETSLRLQGRTGRQAVVQKMSELQKSIDGWEGRDIWQSCSEFILDGVLMKHARGKNTERHVFLFDALIVLCKQNIRRTSVSQPQGEFKLKEKFNIRKIEVRDKEDCDDYKNAFELQAKDHSNHVLLVAKTPEEKSNWMAALISLQTRSMLERQLDAILRDEEKQTPLKLPDPGLYRFAVEDSENNIVFEDQPAAPEPEIEIPQQLLEMLIERFKIPDIEMDPEMVADNNDNLQLRDDLKRFRKEYVKPVQFRVVNVLRHWVDHHFYDFERDSSLLEKLKKFLDTVKGKAMKKMADSILNVIQRRTELTKAGREFTYQKTPPIIEWHLTHNKNEFDLLNLHPIEIARQVTLLEFDLYRAVQPSELVGSVWMKSTKNKTSPNLLKMIDFSNSLTFWLEKCIIETENLEERVAVISRCIEIMAVFQELNNLNGVLEVVSALNSAPVHRLEHSFSEVNHRLIKLMNESKELNSDHFKKYTEKLRSINPPCVPFLGMYLTNILKTEEGNPDFLKRDQEGLINFSKRRKVAEITGEIQQYQNQPYCLKVESDIREFFENLEPLEGRDEKSFNDYLYEKSLEIEPRNCKQIPKFPKKFNYSIKSPGIRPMSRRSDAQSRSHAFSAPGYQRIEEDPESQSPQYMTPPTPTTPISPASLSGGDNGVFSNVTLGQGATSSPSPSANVPTAELVSLLSDTELPPLQPPPPLPPRRRNTNTRDSTSSSASSDEFINRSSSDPPQVPPRTDHDQPPPVPPRRDSYNMGVQPRTPTLLSQSRTVPSVTSRTQSVSQLPIASVQNMQVHKQVNPSLTAKEDALDYIEKLIIQLLATLCASEPHVPQDVEDRVQKTFPDPIDKWAIRDAERAIEKVDNRNKKNLTLVLPVEKIHPLLVKEVLGYRIDYTVTVYIVAVLEYIAADILKLTGNYVKNIKHPDLTSQDIKVAICADQVLMDMFSQEETEVSLPIVDEPVRRESLTYEETVKDFILEENQYLHDLNMIIKVFRAPFEQHFPGSKDLENIFSNILDIHQFTAKLLSSVEEQVEVAAENETPTVGICFQDLAEGEEFGVYMRYVDDMMAPQGKDRLHTLMQRPDFNQTLQGYGSGFKDAMKYSLPKLLLGPIYHCLHYFEVLKALIATSPNEEDSECLEQASGLLAPIKYHMENKFSGNLAKQKPWETSLRLQGRTGRQAVVQIMSELQKSIDGWEGRDIWQSCSEFILDGVLMKHARGKNTERHVFLFDALIVLCKQNVRRTSVSQPQGEFKLKEKFNIRKIEVRDKEDCDDYKNAFELQAKDHSNHVLLVAKTPEEKSNWMAALISLQTRSMLERQLDAILRDEEKQTPLKLPDPGLYRFAVEDSENNIVFEDQPAAPGESPLIKGGTLIKLVERLTYHMYADPKFVKTFLTTYRSFCSPQQLLEMLIERFKIPDIEMDPEMVADNNDNLQLRDDLKRFRKEYVKPVQFRVVNVLRHWVDHHFYDFERDSSLLEKLKKFLDTVKGKAMKKMADSILKVIQRRTELTKAGREFTYQKTPPIIEWHLTHNKNEFDLLNLHPIEIARQVTLLEFDLYRAVQPSELVGSVWMKSTKNKTSPNLLKMKDFTNSLIFWLEKCIIETENLEERVAVISRCIEIMAVFQELNNFNGVLEVVSALNSAPVHRLEHSFSEVNHRLIKLMNESKELNSDHFKKYTEKLRSINPPCVPFLGMYLTNILKTEEGNPDFLKRDQEGLINFSKRRKVAEITGEIQQYQNQPYCLKVEPDIREFFENLEPLEGRDEKSFNDYLYEKSLEIEPRNCKQIPKFPKKFNYSIKSPGIRPMSRRSDAQSRSHAFSAPGYQRIEEDPESQSPQYMTPPTPTTPISPASVSGGDNGVFSNVTLGQGATSSPSPSANVPTAELVSLLSDTELPPLQPPPPLPPRRRNTNTCDSTSSSASSDVFINRSSSDPPQVPPRTDHDQPPPVPPRRDSYNMGVQPRTPTLLSHSRTVPPVTSRTQSVSQLPIASVQNMQVHSNTIPLIL